MLGGMVTWRIGLYEDEEAFERTDEKWLGRSSSVAGCIDLLYAELRKTEQKEQTIVIDIWSMHD